MTAAGLKKTNPDYDAFLPEWLFHIRSYRGWKFYRDGDYLLQHPFESEDNYKRRKATAYFYNYCAPIVDIMGSYLFKTPPVRTYGALSPYPVPPRQPITLFDRFWWDCDYEGSSFDQFMRRIHRLSSIYGRISVIVDKPQTLVYTQREALDNDIRPYLTVITPENLIDWRYMRLPSGKTVLSMVKIKESDTEYRIWRLDGWELWEIQEDDVTVALKDSGEHSLDEIPIVNLYNKKTDIRMVGQSDINDIADINKNIYYLCSDAKEIIENTAFPMLAMPYDKGGQGEDVVTGPKNILQFDPELPNSNPFWLEPPHSSLAEIREWVMQDAQEIARVALMNGIRNIEGSTQPWSGISIEQMAQQLHAVLIDKADNCEQAELDILRLWAKWEGEEFTGNIDYNRDFAIRDMTITLQNAVTAKTAGINSLTFEKARQKEVVRATLPRLEEADRDTIYSEIEKLIEETDSAVAPAGAGVAADNAIQDTALNGAQVTSLIELVTQVAQKQLPSETAMAIIQAAFPAVDDSTINKIISSLASFKPQAQATPSDAIKGTGAEE